MHIKTAKRSTAATQQEQTFYSGAIYSGASGRRPVTVLEVSDFQLHLLPMTRGICWTHSPSLQGKAKDWSNLLDGTCHCCWMLPKKGLWICLDVTKIWKNVVKTCEDQEESSRIRVCQKGFSVSTKMPNPWAKSPSECFIRTWSLCWDAERLRPRSELRTPATWYSAAASWLPMLLPVFWHNGHQWTVETDTRDSHKVHMSY